MTRAIDDPACLSAIGEALGHGPPFSDAELQGLTSLTVVGARSLAGLGGLSGLGHLRIIGSDIDGLAACAGMPALAHLQLFATCVGSLAGLAPCTALERVDLLYTSLTDAGELLSLESFRGGTIMGNPWTEESWQVLQARAASGLLIDLPAVHDWRLTRQLWEGHGLCWGPAPDVMPMVVRPGLPTFTQNAYDAVGVFFISHELSQPDFSAAKLFEDYARVITCPDLSERPAYRTLGRTREALDWIEGSTLPEGEKVMLSRLVRRFPDVTFYRLSQARLDVEAGYESYVLPDWFVEVRRTLEGWLPRPPFIPVRFAEGGHWALSGRDYYLAQYGHAADHDAALIAAGFVNEALAVDDPRAMLAIQLNGVDRQVYAYDILDAGQAIREGRDPSSCFTPVASSWCELLDRIVALLPQDRDPILAVEL